MSRRRLGAAVVCVLASGLAFWMCSGMDYAVTGPATFLLGVALLFGGAALVANTWFAPKRQHIEAPKAKPELAAPDAGPDTCRVCGLDDLAYWDDFDGAATDNDRHVVAYGSGRAHRDCAVVVPYVQPPRDPQREMVHALQGVDRVERENRHDPRNFARWAPGRDGAALREAVSPGACALPVGKPAWGPGPTGDFVISAPGASRGEIVTVFAVTETAGTGRPWALLREPIQHAYPTGARLVPVSYGWGWNDGAGRPNLPHESDAEYLCLCGQCGGPASNPLFLASVRAACGIPARPGEPEPSNLAANLINDGVLSVEDARRIALEGEPVASGKPRDSLGAYWTCAYCRERTWAESDAAAERALRNHSGSCAERRAVGDQMCAPMWTDGRAGAWCAVHHEGDPRCTVIRGRMQTGAV